MPTFRCNHCDHTLFVENVRCLHCGSALAFPPHRLALCAIEPAAWCVSCRQTRGLPGQAVMTSHADGVITLNVAAADDPQRMARHIALHDPYCKLLGQLRPGSGHFHWDRLIREEDRTDSCNALFGDASQDGARALQAHGARRR